ncbi:MAG: iron-containing alcohol dehydrogenase, partial [Bacteroidota bacterium]|nr:iron-containing alcohol dehydrogenase [Bacteroidota bacterium]
LPEVLRFNMSADVKRHVELAIALGVEPKESDEATAVAGIEKIEAISKACGIPQHLTEIGITEDVLSELADIAMNVTRLLKNNPREVTKEDAIAIYKKLL